MSISYSEFFSNPSMPSDPARIVAQVVSGVGFLGAGAILKMGVSVKGLTTASSLWTTAIVGIACGSGYYLLAFFTSAVVFSILTIISRVEKKFLTDYKTRTFKVILSDRPGIVDDIKTMLFENKIKIVSLSASMPNKKTLKLSMVIRMPSSIGMDKLINMINSMSEAESMEIE